MAAVVEMISKTVIPGAAPRERAAAAVIATATKTINIMWFKIVYMCTLFQQRQHNTASL